MLCLRCESEIDDAHECPACGNSPLLEGRYRIERVLGQGANGTTYEATRLADAERVAVKELLVRSAESLKTLELFEREAATLRQLSHPGIPAYHEDFLVDTGPNVGMYLVQDFVSGRPLAAKLEEGPMAVIEVLELVGEVGEILAYLHGRTPAVVHRDVKPANLMMAAGGIQLVDFGSVQDVLGTGDGVPTMAGTVGYMAPEQMRGDASPASDVFGLGATAITAVSGAPPNRADDRWANGLPDPARLLLASMLAVNPSNRPSSSTLLVAAADAKEAVRAHERRGEARSTALQRVEHTPRTIPQNFVWGGSHGRGPAVACVLVGALIALPMLVVGGRLLYAAAAVAVFALIVSAFFLSADRAERGRVRLFTHGATAIGRVLGTIDGQLFFEFEANDEVHRGHTSPPEGEWVRGQDILVLYDPMKPAAHRPWCDCTTAHTLMP